MLDHALPLTRPYADRFDEALATLDRLSPPEQLKLLQKIGIVGPDGKLAPAYAPEVEQPSEPVS